MWIVMLLVALGWNSPSALSQENRTRDSADTAMAEQYAEVAQELLRIRNIVDPAWQASAALLQAANRLNPDDPRYLRLLSEAQLQARNEAGAMDTLRQLVAKDPSSQTAQIQLIDLYLSSLQTADAKVDYLKKLLDVQSIPEPVRSHVALRLARLYTERSQSDQALNMLSQAVRLNAQNLPALQMRYQMLQANGSPLERAKVLMAMLRANPAQPATAAALADEVAGVGLMDDSLGWYGVALNVYNRMGQLPPPHTAINYAAELFISGQSPAAIGWVTQLLQFDPTNVDAWFLRLVIERSNGNKELYDKARQEALVALNNRLQMARQAAGHKDATTRPVDSPGEVTIADVTAEAKTIMQEQTPQEIRSAYTMSLIDLAWFEAYFNEQPALVRKLLEPLKLLLPADNVTLARLEGWALLLEGKKDEAKVKLSAVSDHDPLAALGLIRLADKNAAGEQSAGAIVRRIFNDNPSGVLGALLWGELRSKGAQLIQSQQALGIKMELEKFPSDWLKIIDSPDGFYVLRAMPAQVSHQFGEPMFAQITLRNISNYPLTVSPDGVIRPDLWIDAQLRGAAQQGVPPVFDRFAQQILLLPGQSMTQTVRMDQGALDQMFASNPSISVQVYATVMTNPISYRGGMGPGPAGYKVQFSRIFERAGYPLTSEEAKRKLMDRVNNGSGADRIHAIELLAAYTRFFMSQDAQFRPLVDEFTAALRRAGTEASFASVRAWANYQRLMLLPPDKRGDEIQPLLSESDWQVRLMALVAAGGMEPGRHLQLLDGAAKEDADPVVKKYASSMAALLQIATTQPSATQPANDQSPPSSEPAPTGG
jgi:tetratricopeptide (TPR) repeat protein